MASQRAKLVIPAVLAVCVVAVAPGCGGDSGGSGGGGGSGNPLDDIECYDRVSQDDCEAKSVRACTWDGTYCNPDCGAHTMQAACEDDPTCAWDTGLDECVLPL